MSNVLTLTVMIPLDCTAKAVEHRMSKVKKMTKDSETTSSPIVAKSKPTGKRKGSTATEEADDNGGEGDDESPTKAKKPRAPPKKKATPKMSFDEAAQDDGVKDEEEGEVKIEDAGIVGGEA